MAKKCRFTEFDLLASLYSASRRRRLVHSLEFGRRPSPLAVFMTDFPVRVPDWEILGKPFSSPTMDRCRASDAIFRSPIPDFARFWNLAVEGRALAGVAFRF
jgi:hypothetical protein